MGVFSAGLLYHVAPDIRCEASSCRPLWDAVRGENRHPQYSTARALVVLEFVTWVH